jgi:hypothetical protein
MEKGKLNHNSKSERSEEQSTIKIKLKVKNDASGESTLSGFPGRRVSAGA